MIPIFIPCSNRIWGIFSTSSIFTPCQIFPILDRSLSKATFISSPYPQKPYQRLALQHSLTPALYLILCTRDYCNKHREQKILPDPLFLELRALSYFAFFFPLISTFFTYNSYIIHNSLRVSLPILSLNHVL